MKNEKQASPIMEKSKPCNPHQNAEVIGETGLKVIVRFPDNVRNEQRKINEIYDILNPVT